MPRALHLRQLSVAAVFFLVAASSVASAGDADLSREKRLAEQTVDAIFDGEPVELEAAGHRFLGIHMASGSTPEKGAVIVLHGRGLHPDWPLVARPLRTALPVVGWTTLSLQMPVLEKAAEFYDYVAVFPEAGPRIEAGIRYLRERGSERVILIAHSCSVHMSMEWIRRNGDATIDGYIGIGMGATDYGQQMELPFPFDRLRVPFLEIHGSNDYPAVQAMATDIESIIGDMHPASRQIVIDGADHYFDGHNEELVAAISGWLGSIGR